MRFSAWMMTAALLCPAWAVHAQDTNTYKVDFTIRDTGDAGGKTGRKFSLLVNRGVKSTLNVDFTPRVTGDAGGKTGRKFSLLVNRGVKSTFKVGNRVPVSTGALNSAGLVNTQFSYIDVGMNIDCTVNEAGGRFGMHADLDISTAVMPEKNAVQNPTISQIKLNVDTSGS